MSNEYFLDLGLYVGLPCGLALIIAAVFVILVVMIKPNKANDLKNKQKGKCIYFMETIY